MRCSTCGCARSAVHRPRTGPRVRVCAGCREPWPAEVALPSPGTLCGCLEPVVYALAEGARYYACRTCGRPVDVALGLEATR